MAGPLLRPG